MLTPLFQAVGSKFLTQLQQDCDDDHSFQDLSEHDEKSSQVEKRVERRARHGAAPVNTQPLAVCTDACCRRVAFRPFNDRVV